MSKIELKKFTTNHYYFEKPALVCLSTTAMICAFSKTASCGQPKKTKG